MSFVAEIDRLKSARKQAEFLETLTTALEAEQPVPSGHRCIIRIIEPEPDAGGARLPAAHDIALQGDHSIMDLALFRLAKKQTLAHTAMAYAFAHGRHIEVSGGMHGMASVWDYDLVMMVVSYLVEAVKLYQDGKAPRPGQVLRISIRTVLEFCHRGLGGSQVPALASALQRLGTTRVRHVCGGDEAPEVILDECLIGAFQILHNPRTGKAEYLEITVADWMYWQILEGSPSCVTSLNPDYFRITKGCGRFVYRLARRVAGHKSAVLSFNALYTCSGSTGSQGEFNRILRALIQANDLPDYLLSEEEGKAGMMLRLVHRSRVGKRRGRPCNGA